MGRRPIGLLVAGILLLSSSVAADEAVLAGSEWRPVEIGELSLPDDVDAFVQFRGEGELGGFGGCNRFFGTWQAENHVITIGPLGATRMACPPPLMEHEAALLGALEAARRFERDRIDLRLFDEGGTELARFAQTDAD